MFKIKCILFKLKIIFIKVEENGLFKRIGFKWFGFRFKFILFYLIVFFNYGIFIEV